MVEPLRLKNKKNLKIEISIEIINALSFKI